jgi:hypothetical protein
VSSLESIVYHHLTDPEGVLRECARLIGTGGAVLIVNSTVEILDSLLWLPFFPTARRIDLERLLSRAGRARTARAAGVAVRRQRTVLNPVARDLRAFAARIASRTLSPLRLVRDEEFASGIAEFRRYCEREDRGEVVEQATDVFVLGADPRNV